MKLLRINQAAARRGVSRSRIMQYHADGHLPSIRKNPLLFESRAVDRIKFLKRGRKPAKK